MRWFRTAPLDIKDVAADWHHHGGKWKLVPRRIVLHATAGIDSLAWLTTDSNPPVSAQRLIGRDGRIFKLMDDLMVGYHVGFAKMSPMPFRGYQNSNYTSLGIELENLNDGKQEYPSAQLVSAANQIVEWYGKYGYLPVVSHADMDAGKSDPVNFPWEQCMVLVWDRVASLVGHF